MCGIIAYVGNRPIRDLLVGGLEKLEYRGYDSAGVALQVNGRIESVRAVGNLAQLQKVVLNLPDGASQNGVAGTGIGHTRWATHGRVSEENAHPHFDTEARVHIVLNGIIENFSTLKQRLLAEGVSFTSETDAEVVAHLISAHYNGDLTDAVRRSLSELQGHYAFAAISAKDPGILVGARKECPLVVGRGEEEQFVASAIPAFLQYTKQVQYVENDEIVTVTANDVEFSNVGGKTITRSQTTVDWDEQTAEKGGYETFMLKEIHEQPTAIAETLAGRIVDDQVELSDLGEITDDFLADVQRIVIVACGTSYHAGLVGRYALEQWARIPVEMDIASEYRYRDPIVSPTDLVIGISQSGETADTLAAMRLARERGAKVLAVTNVMGSQATRDAHGTLFTRAGLEIGVAATKTFVSQVTAMYLFALRLGQLRSTLDKKQLATLLQDLKQIPHHCDQLLEQIDTPVSEVAKNLESADFFLYLGRHIGLPVALEGALKLKEISYIATDAYAAGEMKHGPIALLGEETPVVCIATNSPVLEKLVSNMKEVQARGANVIAIGSEGNSELAEHAEQVFSVPNINWMLQPLLAVVPLQLLAYHIARLRGLNVDQPRNLAKTVTVE